MTPGLSTTSRESAFTSHGEIGQITCAGMVKGHAVTGAGTFGLEGILRGTCLKGSGSLTISLSIPTTAGTATFRVPATLMYAAGSGVKMSDAFAGPLVWTAVPTAGDCVRAPITEILQIGEFALMS
jgi:hypothetical protein